MAILHIVLWLIHAVLQALATAIVDVFTNLTAAMVALFVIAAAGTAVASAFGIGGVGLFRRFRRRE